ncbi:GNAT family N-acetyltransferase [Actinopolymorpha singaporensis]|uniref:Ribosomal protein S18 acetylase RimI n=1 Tax=Actinopolymorpha singaporensis TaxID=117157 RepID=A0A1H1PWM0_9ACTN|nr:GNAT family N-acetyltransferase [Actinopolymorpha singaporensis]SDS15630.1 Ribosomal protein S18 acetylase RimI [Actinopolymorpha singaporensis]
MNADHGDVREATAPRSAGHEATRRGRPDLSVRPIGSADLPAWANLLRAVEIVDDQGEHYDTEDLAEEMSDATLSAADDTRALWDGEEMVGYAVVHARPGAQETDRIRLEGAVHPLWRRRGLGTRLLDWMCDRGRQAHTQKNPQVPGLLTTGTGAGNAGARTMLERAGFTPARYFFGMRRVLSEPIPAAEIPEGLTLTTFRPELDAALRATHNETFLDHWGFQPRDEEVWRIWMTGSRSFRGATSHLLLDGDRIAAYVLTYEYEADTAVTGVRDCYIGQVGTRREYRGRGAARALLSRTLLAARDAGFDEASLGVDSVNPTGALGLYERLGFRTRREWVNYDLALDEP